MGVFTPSQTQTSVSATASAKVGDRRQPDQPAPPITVYSTRYDHTNRNGNSGVSISTTRLPSDVFSPMPALLSASNPSPMTSAKPVKSATTNMLSQVSPLMLSGD